MAGAALGAKLLYLLEDPQLTWRNLDDPAYLVGGKTIVGALVFGLLAVELSKRYIGLRTSTGDLYAIPLALGIAIGRIGCFLTGLSDTTYGTPTNLPWAINFGDNTPRHPTQLYEIAFLLALIPLLHHVLNKAFLQNKPAQNKPAKTRSAQDRLVETKIAQNKSTQNKSVILSGASSSRSEADAHSKDPALAVSSSTASRHFNDARPATNDERPTTDEPRTTLLPGDAFKFFMVAYLTFRLLSDFLKPYPRIFLGLGGIQWACVLILLYYSRDIARWLRMRTT